MYIVVVNVSLVVLGTVFVCDLINGENHTQVEGLTHPRHVIYHEHDDETFLIVTEALGRCVNIYDIEGNLLKKFGQKGTMDGEFEYPCCTVPYEGHLLVADHYNSRISEYTYKGKFIKHLLTFKERNGRSCFICIKNNIVMVLLDKEKSSKVICYELPE